MQTFLPYADFHESARVLDRQRLGKQRLEALQLLNGSWPNHPCAKMWAKWRWSLSCYLSAVITEWERRGYVNHICLPAPSGYYENFYENAPFLGDERLHSSHRAALLAKDPIWYGKFGWKENPKIEYFWPGLNYVRQESVIPK